MGSSIPVYRRWSVKISGRDSVSTAGVRLKTLLWVALFVAVTPACQNPTNDDDSGDIPTYAHGDGVPQDSAAIASWATGLGPGGYSAGVGAEVYNDPSAAFGNTGGTSTGVVVLGQGGTIVLDMGSAFADTEGADFAVWENGIAGVGGVVFLELAFVAVSSDGTAFARFPVAARRTTAVGPFESVDPGLYDGFAGVHPLGTGTAFDLSELRGVNEVVDGDVDLASVRYVKITDVVGDGTITDDQDPAQPIYDPYNTYDSGIATNTSGFDLDGVAILR